MKKPIIGVIVDQNNDGNFYIRQRYFDALTKSGADYRIILPYVDKNLVDKSAKVLILDNDSKLISEPIITFRSIEATLNDIDGLLIPGASFVSPDSWYINSSIGQDGDEKRDDDNSSRVIFDKQIIEQALQKNIPILGICGGMQELAIYGGYKAHKSISQGINVEVGLRHKSGNQHSFLIEKDSLLEKILKKPVTIVNSYHSEGMFQEPILKNCIKVAAKSEDGIIEAVYSDEHKFVLGVQPHPEMDFDDNKESKEIFKAFVDSCM